MRFSQSVFRFEGDRYKTFRDFIFQVESFLTAKDQELVKKLPKCLLCDNSNKTSLASKFLSFINELCILVPLDDSRDISESAVLRVTELQVG